MEKLLIGLFVGVFVGAVGYELVKKTEIAKKTTDKISKGFQSAKAAFREGYQSVEKPAAQAA